MHRISGGRGRDHVHRQGRTGLQLGAEVTALDAPNLRLAGGNGELLERGALGTEQLAEEGID